MNPVETNQKLNFADFINHSDIYIETGTCYGQSVERALAAGYKRIRSVEVHQPFYDHCFNLFADKANVELFLGKSDEELPEMLKGIMQPCIIFLDAHPAGPNTGGHDDLMEKGNASEFNQDSILKRELQVILSHRPDHIIIIDDQNGLNADNEAYMEMIMKANKDYQFYFYDEQLDPNGTYYKNKSLVCIPTLNQ
jgi:hypothetical protein